MKGARMYRYRNSEWSVEPKPPLSGVDRFHEWIREPDAPAMAYCLSYLAFAVSLGWTEPKALFTLAAVSVAPLWGVLFGSKSSWAHERLSRLQRLFDIPSSVAQFPVRVIYRKGLTVFGRDVGVISLLNGCVSFEGERSRFNVPQDLPSCCSWSDKRFFESWASCRIQVEDQDVSIDCHFIKALSVPTSESVRGVNGMRFPQWDAEAIRSWDSMPPAPDTEFLLPPLAPSHEEMGQLKRNRSTALLALLCLLLTLAISIRNNELLNPATGAYFVAFVFLAITIASGAYWAWRRRELEWMEHRESYLRDRFQAPIPVEEEPSAGIELNQAG